MKVKDERKLQSIPLPIRIIGGPVFVFLLLFAMHQYLGGLWEEPAITAGVASIALLAWMRVMWPEGFRRLG